MRSKIQRAPYPGPHCTLTTLSFLLFFLLLVFKAFLSRAQLANNKEMAGRGRSFSKVPLEIQGMSCTVEERKEKK